MLHESKKWAALKPKKRGGGARALSPSHSSIQYSAGGTRVSRLSARPVFHHRFLT